MVKTPICTFCAKTGMLCQRCTTRLANGEITELIVSVSKVLTELESSFPALGKATLKRVFEDDGTLILAFNQKSAAVIADTKFKQELEASFKNKIVQCVVLRGSVRKTLSSLFKPLEVIGVDQIWVPDGTEEIKVRLKGEEENLPISLEQLRKIASVLIQLNVRTETVQ